MALRRLGVVGQPQCYAPGERRLRHERAPIPVPPNAQGLGTSLIAQDQSMVGRFEPTASWTARTCADPPGGDRAANHNGHPANGGREGRLLWEAKTGGRSAQLG